MITNLTLTNFRNYKDYRIAFSDITILIGPNGAGKTNILEAVYLLSDGRSWRTKYDQEAIKWDENFCRIVGEVGDKKTIEIFMQKLPMKDKTPPKILKIDGVSKRLIDLLGFMPTVLFSPETIEIISGAPSDRRRFLDILLAQINHRYAINLLELKKVLRYRNKLLFNIKLQKSQIDELEFWDDKLLEFSNFIIAERKKAVAFFNTSLTAVYQLIAAKKENLKIIYHQSADEEKFAEQIVAAREREIEQTSTLYGPHRDDFEIILGDKNIATFGSRGEYRSVVLALKILELRYLEEQMGKKPILLLDDIFSELDSQRRKHLANIVSGQQTIITTTDLDHIDKGLREKAKIVEM